MFNISFTRNGKTSTKVVADIGTNLPVKRSVLCFDWECEHEYISALLQEHLQKQLSDTLSNIRKAAYRQGLKDGRGKKRILTDFYTGFDPDDVGW